MSRRFGLLAGMLLVLFVVGQVAAQQVSVFQKEEEPLPHKYGVQLSGAFAMYSMTDANDFMANGWSGISMDEEASNGIGFGFALLYRSHEHFRWTFGYNHLGQDRAYGTWSTNGEAELLVSAGEFSMLGAYLFPITDWFDMNLTAGPAIINAHADLAATSGQRFSDASGRTFGFIGGVGADLNLFERWAVHFLAGYRMGAVPKLSYTSITGAEEIIYWPQTGNRKLEADYSGMFVELGLRLYFKPATNWVEF